MGCNMFLAIVLVGIAVCGVRAATVVDTTWQNFHKCSFVRDTVAKNTNSSCTGNPIYGLSLIRAQPTSDLDKLLVQELAYKWACRQLVPGLDCDTNPMCTSVVNTCDYVITTSSPTSKSQQAVAVYNKMLDITTCNMTATMERTCVSNPYCIWTSEKESTVGYASCDSRFGYAADFPRYLAYTALGSRLAATLLDLYSTCGTVTPTIDNATNVGDCGSAGAYKVTLDDAQIAALQQLAWVNGTGTGPTIRARPPSPSPPPPLTEDDIYGTVTYYPPGRSGSMVNNSLSSGAEAVAAQGVRGVVVLVVALVMALALVA